MPEVRIRILDGPNEGLDQFARIGRQWLRVCLGPGGVDIGKRNRGDPSNSRRGVAERTGHRGDDGLQVRHASRSLLGIEHKLEHGVRRGFPDRHLFVTDRDQQTIGEGVDLLGRRRGKIGDQDIAEFVRTPGPRNRVRRAQGALATCLRVPRTELIVDITIHTEDERAGGYEDHQAP